ncbi:MAG: ribosome-associated protein, partial [Aeromonas sp.]|nr:ribosome-associated protein [Aeromonas sp.]MBP8280886.1 ribosome-associated protein [Aeromonas sp.]MBP9660271.1 ribosome-associated protein [Aeromonas sp.]
MTGIQRPMSQYQDDNEWEDWGPSKSQLKRDAEA